MNKQWHIHIMEYYAAKREKRKISMYHYAAISNTY